MEQDEFRDCPFCKERIRASAIKCRYCGEWISTMAGSGTAQDQDHITPGGETLRRDSSALDWYRDAGEKGHAGAQNSLAYCYLTGKGAPQDLIKAAELFRQAAEKGLPEAQVNLGIAYAQGQGVQKDYGQAVNWYRRAAEQGFACGQVHLGVAYAKGQGVPKDVTEAAKWYRRAAEQGFAEAQRNLAALHVSGDGVPQDLVEAFKWFTLALDGGFEDAAAGRDELALGMTADQITQAFRLAQMFRPRMTPEGSSIKALFSSLSRKW